jgi:hypothetical protein
VFRVRGYEDAANQARAVGIVASGAVSAAHPAPEAFLAALLHGIGKLVFYRCAVVRPTEPTPDRAYVEALAQELTPSVGVLIADAWAFGPAVAAAVGFAPDAARAPEEHRAFARAVRAAHVAAHTVSEGRSGREVGGLAALVALAAEPDPGALPFDPTALLKAAADAWDGVGAAAPSPSDG